MAEPNLVPDTAPSATDVATLEFIRELYTDARKEKKRYVERWNSFYRLVRNHSWSDWRDRSLPAPTSSELFPAYSTLIAYITDQIPQTYVSPDPDLRFYDTPPPQELLDMRAKEMETVLASKWVMGGFGPTTEMCLWDCFTFGAGICRTGFDPTANQGKGDVFFRWVDPYRLAPDPNASSFEDASYVVEVSDVPLFEIVARFPERGRDVRPDLDGRPDTDLRPKARGGTFETVTQTGAVDRTGPFPGTTGTSTGSRWARAGETTEDYTQTVRLVEVWIRSSEQMTFPVISAGERTDDLVIEVPRWDYIAAAGGVVLTPDITNPFDHGGLPYERLPFTQIGGEFWGASLTEHLRPNQVALNRLLAAMQRHAEIAGNPILLEPEASGISRAKIVNRPGTRLTTNMAATNLVRWLEPPNMSPAVMQLIGFHRDSIDRISGISAVARGTTLRRREAAASVDAVQEASFTRIRAVIRNYEDWLRGVMGKTVSNVVQFQIDPQVMPVVGPRGSETSITLGPKHWWVPQFDPVSGDSKDDEAMRFAVQVAAGSSEPLSRAARSAEADMLREGGALSTVDWLKARDWHDPEGTARRAQEEQGLIQAAEELAKQKEQEQGG